MFLLLIFIFLIVLIYNKYFVKDSLSLLTVNSFVVYWFLSLCISTFNPYNLNAVSDRSYMLLILNVLSFVLGFSVVKIAPQVKYSYNDLSYILKFNINKLLQNNIFKIIIIGNIILCIHIFSIYSQYLVFGEGRVDAMIEMSNDINQLSAIIFTFVCPPLFYISSVLLAYMIINYRKWGMILLLLTYVISYSIIGGGRVAFLVILIGVFFVKYVGKNIFSKKERSLSSKDFFIVVTISVIMLTIMSWLSAIRDGYTVLSWETLKYGNNKLNKEFITYSLIPFRLFDYAINNNYIDIIGMHYGMASLDGLNRYAHIILNKFGISIPLITLKTTQFLQDNWISVGTNMVANYSYTNALYHYLDFAEFGIFIFPFAFGILYRIIIKKYYKNASLAGFFLLFYLFYVLVHTIFTWHIQKTFSLAFIIICLYLSNKKPNIL